MDTRNEYRAVSRVSPSAGEYWRVEFHPWWWPFWSCIGVAQTIAHAKERAELHASAATPVIRVAIFGRLP